MKIHIAKFNSNGAGAQVSVEISGLEISSDFTLEDLRILLNRHRAEMEGGNFSFTALLNSLRLDNSIARALHYAVTDETSPNRSDDSFVRKLTVIVSRAREIFGYELHELSEFEFAALARGLIYQDERDELFQFFEDYLPDWVRIRTDLLSKFELGLFDHHISVLEMTTTITNSMKRQAVSSIANLVVLDKAAVMFIRNVGEDSADRIIAACRKYMVEEFDMSEEDLGQFPLFR